jgi:hypothetical protein
VTVQTRLARIDRAIELGRSEYLSAYFCGATQEARDYADHVDRLLLLRFRVQNLPDTLPTITTRKDAR